MLRDDMRFISRKAVALICANIDFIVFGSMQKPDEAIYNYLIFS